ALLVLLAGIVPAKDESGRQYGTEKAALHSGELMRTGVNLYRGHHFLGTEVRNLKGETIGTVKDIVLNDSRDAVSYVAVGIGSGSGAAEKIIAVPWGDFRIGKPAAHEKGMTGAMKAMHEGPVNCLAFDVTTDRLAKLPGIEAGRWPDKAFSLAEQEKALTVASKPVTETQPAAFELRRLTKLIGLDVRPDKELVHEVAATPETAAPMTGATESRPAGEAEHIYQPIGSVKDVVFNAHNGRIIYGVVLLSKLTGYENESSIVPWSALSFESTEPLYARLNVPDVNTLLAYTPAAIQERALANRGFARDIFEAYNRQPQWEVLGFVSPEPAKPMGRSREMNKPLEPTKRETGKTIW
ncbi:MAG: PRC-barrel domain-containing protein, partial [bacterium]|nr:PRC-barrel domain-containing protein [bacterium]